MGNKTQSGALWYTLEHVLLIPNGTYDKRSGEENNRRHQTLSAHRIKGKKNHEARSFQYEPFKLSSQH